MADTFPKNTIDDNGLKKVWDMVMDRLNLKVDKEAGKGLSTNDYTTTEKNKLAGIANGAEVNTVTSVAGKTGAVTLNKSDVGLSNVGNFKAVSTSANQGLTDTEKSNARANIDTPSNGDIQSSKTFKSSVVTVTDAAPINAEDITVDITPVQLGSGTPSPDNIRPIQGWTGAELDRVGKNLVFMESGDLSATGLKTVDAKRCRTGNMAPIKANTDYVISAVTANTEKTLKIAYQIWEENAFGGNTKLYYTSWTSSPVAVRRSSDCWITITAHYTDESSIDPNDLSIQFEEGTQPTAYEPYQGEQYTADFGETVYGGKWHVTEGGTDKTHANIANYNGETINEPWLSSMDEYSPGATPTTGAQVVYPLTTPTTISTPKQNVPMLKGINTVYADCGDTQLKYQPDNVIGELKGAIEKINSVRPKIYGFHIDSNESDPSAAVTYLQDAVGMRPAKMDYIKDVFDYGSWEDVWFVRDCKPCVLHRNGYVISYLDKNDFSKDIYGDPVYLSIPNHQVMIEFPKIWYKVVPDLNDSSSASVYISPVKLDEDYVDFAYIDSSGAHKEHFYMSAYNACAQTESGTRYLCSLPGQAVSKSLTGQNEINACKALGTGWYTEDAGEIILINFLLILMGKSLDTKTVFGQGLHTGGSEAINDGFRTGVHNTKGMFYGTNSGAIASNNYNNAVKIFGIENYWGFQWRRYAGDMLVDGHRKIKLCYGNDDDSTTKEFNSTGDGYVDIGCTPSGTSGGYISKMKYTSNGMFSSVSSGTASTYYCSGQWYNNSGTMYAFRGGNSYAGALVGAFFVGLINAFGGAWWACGASPSYK